MEKKFFQNFFRMMQETPYAVRYWDGTEEKYGQGSRSLRLFYMTKSRKLKF